MKTLFKTTFRVQKLTGTYNELIKLTGNSIACVFIRVS